MADEHVHNYSVNEVLSPQGTSSDGKRAVYVVEDHYFCACGSFKTISKGMREV